ncbi:CGNR zinc finger domain-containing protein [Nocardiopsis aegyptia]|uniref:Putative RNA-binding Zn ribbon-like protein n=1 Tax=Nocardiopsis aegyptia TaxID=220378 RepID=A0A7Z0EIM0_9ACTN|nr:CGNR zinc finger domain-containing protein [Nocardiopsis aegyptia]NYJ32753.1 putative RNA-binding Zn ribbon-like protein [Nocardiopsis aegyptia]
MEQPEAARRIERFTNTFDLESGRDDLADSDVLARWLVDNELVEPGTRVDAADHRACLDLRTGIREVLVATGEPDPHPLARADALLAELPVLVSLTSAVAGRPVLVPAPDLAPVRRACVRLALDWVDLVLTGRSVRLKRCAEHTCGWVFWDGSKNQSRRWCSMRVCGNRTKSRRHTERTRRAAAPAD